MCPVINALRRGLLSASQRRGVTPLVTLKNFSGAIRWKSLSTVCFSSSVWSAATPLMAWLPADARLAMRTYCSPVSSMIDRRRASASSPGCRSRTASSNRRLISRTISRWRGRSAPKSGSGHFSSASASSVWFV